MKNRRKKSLAALAGRLWRWLQQMQIPFRAAAAGYFLILSAFPALVLMLGLLRFTGLRAENLMEFIRGLLPDVLEQLAARLVVSVWENSSGGLVGVSAVAALWSAGRGIYGLMEGLNAVWDVRETRSWLVTRLICMGYTLAFFLVLILALAVHLFGSRVLGLGAGGRFLLLTALQTLVFTLMFMALPNCRSGFRGSLPGALLASAGWLLFSGLYSVYAEHFASLRSIYGSVYAVALGMLWLYFGLCIVFYGGALNRWLGSSGGK